MVVFNSQSAILLHLLQGISPEFASYIEVKKEISDEKPFKVLKKNSDAFAIPMKELKVLQSYKANWIYRENVLDQLIKDVVAKKTPAKTKLSKWKKEVNQNL